MGAGSSRALQAELAIFTPAGTFFALAALLAERYIILAFAAFRAVRAAIDGTIRADIAAAFAQIFLIIAILAVAAVMLLPAFVIVGLAAAVIAARADPVIAQMGTAVLAVGLLIPRVDVECAVRNQADQHNQCQYAAEQLQCSSLHWGLSFKI